MITFFLPFSVFWLNVFYDEEEKGLFKQPWKCRVQAKDTTYKHTCMHTRSVHYTHVGQHVYEWIIPVCCVSFFFSVFFFFFFRSLSFSTSFSLPIDFFSEFFSSIYVCLCVSTSCRERTCKKTELTKENFTRPILPLSTFCVLHLNSNVEKKRKRRAERARNGTIFIL